MKLLHFDLYWKLLIFRHAEYNFCNFNLCFNIYVLIFMFWILKHFYLNFSDEDQRRQHFVNLAHFRFVEQFIVTLLEGLPKEKYVYHAMSLIKTFNAIKKQCDFRQAENYMVHAIESHHEFSFFNNKLFLPFFLQRWRIWWKCQIYMH